MRNEPSNAGRRPRTHSRPDGDGQRHAAGRSGGDRQPYPSDLSDEQWRKLHQLLIDRSAVTRCRPELVRDVADAVNYRWTTGCSWRMLPHDFPQWSCVYGHFRRWRERGVLATVRDIILTRGRINPAARPASPPPSPPD